jgi:hypothetical protein
MEAQVGSKALREAGLRNPADLLPFPWDKATEPALSDEERKEMQAFIDAENERRKNAETQ